MAYLDSSGLAHFLAKLKSSFLPTSGGTMSGVITRNGMLAQSGNTSGSISIQNGTAASGGGGIWMYGASNANAGKVRIQAYDATNKRYCALDANGDGTLTWLGKNVITADGGTMSGPLTISGNWANGFLKQASDDSYTSIVGSTAAANGAYMSLSGKDRNQYPGYFRIVAQDGTNSSLLEGRPDGTLSWGGDDIRIMRAATLSIAAGTSGLTVKLYRRDDLVICNLGGTANSIAKGSWATIATITDADFIPAAQTPYQTLVPQNKANEPFLARVTTAGAIQINPALAVLDGYVNACFFYFVEP